MGTSLRLVLLVVGIIILAVVIWDVLRSQTKKLRTVSFNDHNKNNEEFTEPVIHDISEPELASLVLEYEPVVEPEPIEEGDFFAINVIAREDTGFKGDSLLKEFTNIGLEYGKWSIFHKMQNGEILFSVASSKEPGIFKKNIGVYDYFPGISLFFIISKSSNPQLALDEVVKFAKKIAFKLNGELLDKNNNSLTLQTLSLYKSNINKYKIARL